MDTVGDTPLPSHSQDSTTNKSTSYDELRQMNRAEHEKKKFESFSRPPQASPPVSSPAPTEPAKTRK